MSAALLLERDDYAAGLAVKAELGPGVADVQHYAANQGVEVT